MKPAKHPTAEHHVPAECHAVDLGSLPRNHQFHDYMNALMLLNGEIRRNGPIAKTVFPTATTKPTEKECYAALARTLEEAAERFEGEGADEVLWALASCFDPKSKHRRKAEIKNRGKDYETDEDRDESIAWQVWKLAKTKGKKRAVAEVAALIGRSGKAVRDARKRVAGRYKERGLRDLEKLHT
jgi:hypothetical protein